MTVQCDRVQLCSASFPVITGGKMRNSLIFEDAVVLKECASLQEGTWAFEIKKWTAWNAIFPVWVEVLGERLLPVAQQTCPDVRTMVGSYIGSGISILINAVIGLLKNENSEVKKDQSRIIKKGHCGRNGKEVFLAFTKRFHAC